MTNINTNGKNGTDRTAERDVKCKYSLFVCVLITFGPLSTFVLSSHFNQTQS